MRLDKILEDQIRIQCVLDRVNHWASTKKMAFNHLGEDGNEPKKKFSTAVQEKGTGRRRGRQGEPLFTAAHVKRIEVT